MRIIHISLLFIVFSLFFLCQYTYSQSIADEDTSNVSTPTPSISVDAPLSSPDTLYFYGHRKRPENQFGIINEKGELRIETNLPLGIRRYGYAKIGQLNSLQILDLSRNNLTSLPVEIGQLTNLETLNLSQSKNLTSLPVEIGQLSNLQTLYLYANNFSEEEKQKIKKLLPNCEIIF